MDEKNTLPRMRTIAAAAVEVGLPVHAVRQLVAEGRIVHVRIGRKALVNLDKLIEFLEQGDDGAYTERQGEGNE